MTAPDRKDPRVSPAVRALAQAVLTSPGDTSSNLRRAAFERAAAQNGGLAPDGELPGSELPGELARHVDKVSRHAYQINDDDIASLRSHGHSEDAIFEITISAAIGAGLGHLERGLAALAGAAPARDSE